MTPAEKRRAARRKHLQKGPRELGNFVRAPGPNSRRYDVLKDLLAKRAALTQKRTGKEPNP